MKAALFYGPYDLRVEEVDYPRCEDESVIIKIHRASICNGSDVALFSGRRDRKIAYPWMEVPWIQGHECAGEVVEVGKKVKEFNRGDRVTSLKYGNAFAEFQSVSSDLLIRIPDGMPYDQATFIEPLWCTQSYMDNLHPGDSVIACGLGPSGLFLMQESIATGASKVCALDRISSRLQMAKKLGADVTINVTENDTLTGTGVETLIKSEFGEVDVFIDATGYDVYDFGLKVLKDGGRFVMYGVPDSGVKYNGTRAFFKNIQFCGDKRNRLEMAHEIVDASLKFVAEGKVKLDAFTTHHFPLEKVPEAIRLVMDHPEEAIGVVIDV